MTKPTLAPVRCLPWLAAIATSAPLAALQEDAPTAGEELSLGLVAGWLETVRSWVVVQGPQFALRLLFALLILFVFRFLARWAARAVDRAIEHSTASNLLQDVLVSLVRRLVFFAGILVALSQVGVDLGPILAGLGVAGFIVGFAVKDTLSNFAAGLMILIYRPYDEGDVVEAGGVIGTVREMTIVSTTIITPDNQKIVVPNNSIWGGVIRNVTAEPTRRVDLSFGIAYEDDIPHAEEVLAQVVASHDLILPDPEPVIRLHALGDSSVDFIVRSWAKTEDYWKVYWDLTRTVKLRFDEEGISFPYPQRDVHLVPATEAAAAAPEAPSGGSTQTA